MLASLALFYWLAQVSEHTTSQPAPPLHQLTLAEAERRAATHPAARLAAQLALAAEARAAETRSPLLPQVSFTANYREATGNRAVRIGTLPLPAGVSRAPPSPTTFDYLNLSATASQLLYDFGQSTNAWRSARAAAQAAGFDARAAALAVQLQVRLAFFAVLARRELVAVAYEDLDNQQRHLVEVESSIAVQTRPPIDLVQARASVAAADLRRIAAQNDLALAKADLCHAIGQPAEFSDDLDVANDELAPVGGEDDLSRAPIDDWVAARPDFASGQRAIDSAQLALDSARGSFGPALRLVLGATDAGPMWDPGPFRGDSLRWNYSAALVLSWAIFEGGRGRARVDETAALLDAAKERQRALVLDVSVEVERARRSVAAGKASVSVAAVALENSRERLRLADGRYRAGVGTALEVSDAQLAETSAAAQAVQARYDLASARTQLLHAMGASR